MKFTISLERFWDNSTRVLQAEERKLGRRRQKKRGKSLRPHSQRIDQRSHERTRGWNSRGLGRMPTPHDYITDVQKEARLHANLGRLRLADPGILFFDCFYVFFFFQKSILIFFFQKSLLLFTFLLFFSFFYFSPLFRFTFVSFHFFLFFSIAFLFIFVFVKQILIFGQIKATKVFEFVKLILPPQSRNKLKSIKNQKIV